MKLGFFNQVKDSFTNFDSYKQFLYQKAGKTFKYFILVFTLIFVIEGIKFSFTFNSQMGNITTDIKELTPEFSLSGGKFSVEGPQPLVYEGDGKTVLIVDTTGQTDKTVLDNYNEGVYISQDTLVTKQNYQERVIKFSDFKNVNFNKDKLLETLPKLLPVIGIFAYVFGMAWALITTVFMALIGLIINSSTKGKLNFGNTWNGAVYALTLPWFIEMAVNLVYPVPVFWAIKWGLATYILYRGIQAAKRPPVEESSPTENTVI